MEFELGGVVLELPDGATPEQVKNAIAGFRESPAFDKIIDKSTGAPVKVRTVAGNAPPEDRLANIRMTYPDAQPYKDDNFVFTNPETGRITLYNPVGLDIGDVPSIGRELSMMGGATVGAAGAGVGTMGLGTAVGAGLGAAAGGQAFDVVREFVMEGINTQTLGERVGGAVFDFGSTAVGQRLGEAMPVFFKRVVGGLKPKAQKVVEAFRRLHIDPPGGAATGSRSLATVESMLEANPASGDIMQKQAETVIGQTGKAARELAKKFGRVRTDEGSGAAVRQAAEQAQKRTKEAFRIKYDEAFDLVGANRRTFAPMVAELREEMIDELSKAPHSMRRSLSPVIRRAEEILTDEGEKGIPFDVFRKIRSDIGRELRAPVGPRGDAALKTNLDRLYNAITKDMTDTTQAASAKGGKLLKQADRAYRLNKENYAKMLEKITKMDDDGKIFRSLMTSARDGGKMLAKLRGQFTPEEWDDVAASSLARMGSPRGQAFDVGDDAFSVATFLTNWTKLSPKARKALFSGKRYQGLGPELDKLVTAARSLQDVQKVANTSNTGRTMIAYTLLQTLVGGMVGTAAGGDTQSGLMGAGAAILAPRAAAKLITSPKFIRWLTAPVTNPNAIGPHMGRLLAITKGDPELQEAAREYLNILGTE